MSIIPFGMSFRDALIRGYAGSESRLAEWYLELVRDLPCVVCQAPPKSDPHHIIPPDTGYKGFNYKTPDVWAIPLCRQHHNEFHHIGGRMWEERYGSQMEYALLTLAQLVAELRVGPRILHQV